MLQASTVFKDETILTPSHVPQNILFRDGQLRKMIEHYKGLFRNESFLQSHLVLVGNEGTGKTLAVNALGKSISFSASRYEKNISYLHVDCSQFRTSYEIMNHVMRQFIKAFPKKGLSTAEIMEKLQQHLSLRQIHLILALDEIETLVLHNTELLYQLVRLWETQKPRSSYQHGLHLILVTRQLNMLKDLDSSTFSSLQKNIVFFENYTPEQLEEILLVRAKKAFLSDVISREAISFLARQVEYHQGNCRKALETLRRAGITASRENLSKITIQTIQKAMEEINNIPNINRNALSTLTPHELLVLYTIVKGILDRKHQDQECQITTNEIKSLYQEICRQLNVIPLKHTRFWEIIQELASRGLISKKVRNKKDPRNPARRVRGRTTFVALPFPQHYWNQLENNLFSWIFG